MSDEKSKTSPRPIKGALPTAFVFAVLPGDPPSPCPELLTEAEAIRYLRLDDTGVEGPSRTLVYYRQQGLLRATQVGRRLRYRRIELERLLERLTDINPR